MWIEITKNTNRIFIYFPLKKLCLSHRLCNLMYEVDYCTGRHKMIICFSYTPYFIIIMVVVVIIITIIIPLMIVCGRYVDELMTRPCTNVCVPVKDLQISAVTMSSRFYQFFYLLLAKFETFKILREIFFLIISSQTRRKEFTKGEKFRHENQHHGKRSRK